MEPIPETIEAVEEFGPFTEDDLLEGLREKAAQVRAIVPDCVGLSLTSNEEGVTFTLVSSAEEVARLDALQYLDGGPCVQAIEINETLAFRGDDPLDEDRWRLFTRGTAAAAVASTLSLPILTGDTVVGGINLYAASSEAFAGHHDEVAAVFDAWAPGAVTNADLSFTTRATAEQAPAKLRDDVQLEVAVGILAAETSVSFDAARAALRDAARRADLSEAQLARTITELGRRLDS